jgi:DNA helicase-2/ATP-dependent DNA helicase PcrA
LLEHPPGVPAAASVQFNQFRAMVADCLTAKPSARRDGSKLLDIEPELANRQPREDLPPGTQVERIRRFYEPILEQRYDNAKARLRDLEQLELIAAGYKSQGQFITDLTLDPPNSTQDFAGAPLLEEDYLILSTIHSAKGCEWDSVHVIHAADGNIPSDMALTDDQGLEEERRLFYVALTRAKNQLSVYFPLRYYAGRRGKSDRHTFAQLTRFIPIKARHLFEHRGVPSLRPTDARVQAKGTSEAVDAALRELWS